MRARPRRLRPESPDAAPVFPLSPSYNRTLPDGVRRGLSRRRSSIFPAGGLRSFGASCLRSLRRRLILGPPRSGMPAEFPAPDRPEQAAGWRSEAAHGAALCRRTLYRRTKERWRRAGDSGVMLTPPYEFL